jgi:hypothetical protein
MIGERLIYHSQPAGETQQHSFTTAARRLGIRIETALDGAGGMMAESFPIFSRIWAHWKHSRISRCSLWSSSRHRYRGVISEHFTSLLPNLKQAVGSGAHPSRHFTRHF